MRKLSLFLCLVLLFTVLLGGSTVCSAEAAGTSFPFFTAEINRLIDENYKLVQENGWAELRIPESVHGISRDIFSPNALDAAEKLINAGYEAYCIGGAVRDLVMGTPTMDFDITTTAPNEEFEKILGDVTFHTIPSGLSFGYAHYPDEIIDVASCVNIPVAYRGLPGVPDFDPDALYSGSFVADSFQRDLTFNAIYYDFRTGELVDYHGGLHDIREGIVDTMVDPYVAIADDPRIAIRGIRFAARYNFRLSDRMEADMMKNGPKYAAKNQPGMNKKNLAKYYDAGYARRCLDNLEKYNMFTAIYMPAAELYKTDAYKEYIRAAADWMDEWHAAGRLMDGNLSIAAFLWPAVEGLEGETLLTAAKALFAAQQTTIQVDEEMEVKFLAIYELQAKLAGGLTEEEAQELLQHPHFMDAFELLMIRSMTNPDLNTAVQFWTERTEKQLPTDETSVKETSGKILTAGNPDQTFERGNRTGLNGISVVSLYGTWYEMGRQYGALMKYELQEMYSLLEIIGTYNIGNYLQATRIIKEQTDRLPYRINEFLRGAAETSELSTDQLQAVNAMERIIGLPMCSAAICWNDYAEGPLVVGRNYDYSEALTLLKDAVAVTVFHPADGSLSVATVGYIGEIYAVNGLNEKGIFMELNNGKPSAPITPPEARITGTTMLFNALFEIDELKEWDLFFSTVNNSSSYIINVADSQSARSYEWCPIGYKVGGADLPDGLLVSTNYYVNEDWLFFTPSDKACWDGITRRKNLITLCDSAKGKIDAQKMMEIIETTEENGGAQNEMTVYQMVVVPETKTMWIRVIGGAGWTQIDLSGFLAAD